MKSKRPYTKNHEKTSFKFEYIWLPKSKRSNLNNRITKLNDRVLIILKRNSLDLATQI